MNKSDYFINSDLYNDIDINKAVDSLSSAVKCKTISYTSSEEFCNEEFQKMHNVLKNHFPKVFGMGEVKLFDKSLLIKLVGKNPMLKPILLMAHQDVVYADNNGWEVDAFSGLVKEGYIWGRGTEDIKSLMLAHLNACEYYLSHNTLNRTIYLSFGHDEEVGGFNGTKVITEYLENNNVELEAVIDEGFGFINDGTKYGVSKKLIGEVGIFEKGYLDMKIDCHGEVGHSSNPFNKTSLEVLAEAITKVTTNPIKPSLPKALKEALVKLYPIIDQEPLKEYMVEYINSTSDDEKNLLEEKIIDYFLKDELLNIYVKTTIAPTVITGSSKATNVMPGDMSATINFRLNESDTSAKVMDYYKKLISNDRISISSTRTVEPSKTSNINSLGYTNMEKALKTFYKDVEFIPSVTTCATDARHFKNLSDVILRIYPFFNRLSETNGIHGVNEKMDISAYIQGIKVIIKYIELMQM